MAFRVPVVRSVGGLVFGLAGCLSLSACEFQGDGTGGGAPDVTTGAVSSPVSVTSEGDGAPAQAVLTALRSRFQLRSRDPLAQVAGTGAGAVVRKTAAVAPQTKPVIGPSAAARFVRAGERFQAKTTEDASVEVWVPQRASEAFGLRDRTSGLGVQARLAGARQAAVAVAEGLAVYEGAGPTGGTVVHRLTDTGTEDYVTFETQPPVGELSYDIELTDVAGLRLVGNTLELLDAGSSPRLRISPPFVVGARGEVVAAELSVGGCAVDRDPAAPWDRAPVAPGNDHCRVAVRWDASAVSYPAIVDPSWSSTANMASPRAWFISAAINTNRVLVSGGYSDTFAVLASAELYNPTTRTWAATGNMVNARVFHAAAVRGGGRVLVSGGTGSGGSALTSSESYNPATGTWGAHGAMNKARSQHRLTTLGNGDVLVTGGTQDGTMGAQRFSDANATWSSAGIMLSAFTQHSATLLNDGRVLLVGNQTPSGQLFQPSNNSWIFTASTPESRIGHGAARLANGKVLVAGGSTPEGPSMTAEVFDPSTNAFTYTGGLWRSHGTGVNMNLLDNGRVLLFGGSVANNNRTNAEIYDPTWGTWRPGPSLSGRVEAISARMQNNRILIAGGTSSGGFTPMNTATEFVNTNTATTVSEYKFPPASCTVNANCSSNSCINGACVDPDVRASEATEIWAAVYRPTTLPAGRLPVLLFLHGNHGSCGTGSNPRNDDSSQYTVNGTCPPNYVVTPNHRGYDYIANELASRGYIVVSINANRGITGYFDPDSTDTGLILARGRLMLKHLQRLSEWNRGAAATPASIGVSLNGKLDLTQVGMMGHSRGGEGARAAYNLYRAGGSPWPARIVDPVTFRGIIEIGPTEWRGTENAHSTNRSVILPMCDGDVSNLAGVQAFDRMIRLNTEVTARPKSTYTVWGTNHNYFNSEWQMTDSGGCVDHPEVFSSGPGVSGSPQQRQSGFIPMLAFFTANVGNTNAPVDTWYNNIFNPELPWEFSPHVDRGYTPALGNNQNLILEDFTNAAGTSSYNLPNSHGSILVNHGNIPEHPSVLRGGDISWLSTGAFFQTNFAASGAGFNLSTYQMLELRVDRFKDDNWNLTPTTAFSVQLVNANNTLSSPLGITSFLGGSELTGPVGGPGGYHSMLQTARIPLSSFTGANLSSIRGVRLTFDTTQVGRIYVANIRATRTTLVAGLAAGAAALVDSAAAVAPATTTRSAASRAFKRGLGAPAATRRITAGNEAPALRSAAPDASVSIDVVSATPFMPRDSALELWIGGTKVPATVQSSSGDLKRVTFTVDRASFDALADGDAMRVRYESADVEWDFGTLNKSRLAR